MKIFLLVVCVVGVLTAGVYFAYQKLFAEDMVGQRIVSAGQARVAPAVSSAVPAAVTDGNSEQTDLEILPALASSSSAKNQVWTGVFQLVWNDLATELNKAPIRFAGGNPETVTLLNQSSFNEKELSASAYYKKWGQISPALKTEIEQGIWQKFHEKSRILDDFDWSPNSGYFLYAMLKKDLAYREKFNKLGEQFFLGSAKQVSYFGVPKDGDSGLKKSVRVLFYKNFSDFAVTLQSTQGDLIHLYRTDGRKTLAQLYADMQKKSTRQEDYLRSDDSFKAPALDFTAKREFPELSGKPITPSGFIIQKALEAVQFKMDEAGTKLVAEAGIAVFRGSMGPRPNPGREFHFTGPYAVFMEEPGKHPYFAAYITDPASLQKK